jgi:hypothetical protein
MGAQGLNRLAVALVDIIQTRGQFLKSGGHPGRRFNFRRCFLYLMDLRETFDLLAEAVQSL